MMCRNARISKVAQVQFTGPSDFLVNCRHSIVIINFLTYPVKVLIDFLTGSSVGVTRAAQRLKHEQTYSCESQIEMF